MPIFCDPTELREGSPIANLPGRKDIVPVQHLEMHTGADYLITRSKLAISKAETVPELLMLDDMCAEGILVQRKSGTDLANSIPGLKTVLQRMLERCPRAYLAPVGYFDQRPSDAILVVNDAATSWKYAAYVGALESWSFHGGHIMAPYPTTDSDFIHRLTLLEKRLLESTTETLALPAPTETIKAHPKADIIRMLLTFPGVGDKLAVAVAEWAPTGWEAIMALTHPVVLKLKTKPDGLGKKTLQDCRDFLGIPADSYGLGLYLTPDDDERTPPP